MRRYQCRGVRVGWEARVARARRPPLRLVLVIAVACLLFACQRDEKPAPQASKPRPTEATEKEGFRNVVLITLDTARADALGSYGQPLKPTPNLDHLAEEGVYFTQCAASSPNTLPSHATIFTGKHPYAHGARSNWGYVLSNDNVTLAEVLSSHGFVTGAEVAAPVVSRDSRLNQGFDHFRDLSSPGVERLLSKPGADGELRWIKQRGAADITAGGIEFLRKNRARRFFLWLHYFDPHSEYQPPAPFLAQMPSSPYHAEILYADHEIGRFLKRLGRLGLADQTLIVFTADHGEGLEEHHEHSHSFFVYETTMRVPLIVRWPSEIPAGRRVSSLVRSVDIAPTILDLLGLPPLNDVQGVSLRPLLVGASRDLGLTAYGESIEHFATFDASVLRFVREGKWKLIHKRKPELYDLEADPHELRSLAERRPEVVERLRGRLGELLAAGKRRVSDSRVEVDGATRAQLIALGYVGVEAPEAVGDDIDTLELRGRDPNEFADAIQRYAVGWGHIKAGKHAAGEVVMRGILEEFPESRAVLHGLVAAVRHQNRPQELMALLERAIEADASAEGYAVELVILASEHGQLDRADRVVATVIDRTPCAVKPQISLATALGERGRFADQLAVLRSGVEACPASTDLRNNYAYLLATSTDDSLRDGELALELAYRVVREGGDQASYLDTLACALAEVGRFEDAVRVARSALASVQKQNASQAALDVLEAHLAAFRSGDAVRE